MHSDIPSSNKSVKLTYIALIAITCYSFIFSGYWTPWLDRDKGTPFVQDPAISYWYVTATFINHDYKIPDVNGFVGPDALGRVLPKYTYGMGLMMSPSFFVGHELSQIYGEPLDGYSKYYGLSVHYGCIVYGLLGLLVLCQILLRYFSDRVAALTLILIFLGTNMMINVLMEGERVHGTLFFLFSLFLWLTIKWHEKPTVGKSILVGLVAGIIIVTRPPDILITLVFILYGINGRSSFKEKLSFFLEKKLLIFLIVLMAFLIILPQLIFWKVYAGTWIYDAYGREGFFWLDPKILKMLFSYRNGWFLYSPVMLFAFVGLFLMKKYASSFSFGVPVFVLINIYVLASWWCWWYMGFGLRSVVQSYPIMALGLASFIASVNNLTIKRSLRLKYVFGTVLCFLICLNLVQSYQYRTWLFGGDGMSKNMYWKSFCKTSWTGEEIEYARKNFPKVDVDAAVMGKR